MIQQLEGRVIVARNRKLQQIALAGISAPRSHARIPDRHWPSKLPFSILNCTDERPLSGAAVDAAQRLQQHQ
jgi:hypothetical protein